MKNKIKQTEKNPKETKKKKKLMKGRILIPFFFLNKNCDVLCCGTI